MLPKDIGRYERRNDRILPFGKFLGRLAESYLLAGSIIGVALGLGIIGYHFIGGLSWVDALLNASMILTGMGPVNPMNTTAAKLFASAYALFSGVIFLTAMGLVLSPVFHRILHHFHLPDEYVQKPAAKGSMKKG